MGFCRNFFTVIALATFLQIYSVSTQAEEISCEDARLKEMLKPELDLESVEKKCQLSSNAQFARTPYRKRDGSVVSASCCAAVRMQMHESSELQLEEKRRSCAANQAAASQMNCSGRGCYEKNIQLVVDAQNMYRQLRARIRESEKIGKTCEAGLSQAPQMISREVEIIHRTVASAATQQEKYKILSSATMGTR